MPASIDATGYDRGMTLTLSLESHELITKLKQVCDELARAEIAD
jgi:hypothetical protein